MEKKYKIKNIQEIDQNISDETEKEILAIIIAFVSVGLMVPTVGTFPVDSKFPLLQADYISIIATELAGAGISLKAFLHSLSKKRTLQQESKEIEEPRKHL